MSSERHHVWSMILDRRTRGGIHGEYEWLQDVFPLVLLMATECLQCGFESLVSSLDFSVRSWVLACTESPFYPKSFCDKFVDELIFEGCALVGYDLPWNAEFAEYFLIQYSGLFQCLDIFYRYGHDEIRASVDESQDVVVTVLRFGKGSNVVDMNRVPWFRHQWELGQEPWF